MPKRNLNERKHWRQLYESGLTIQQIADRENFCFATVLVTLRDLGTQIRSRRTPSRYQRMFDAGRSMADIARHFGVTRQAVDISLKRRRLRGE